jgi:hypothetical protein
VLQQALIHNPAHLGGIVGLFMVSMMLIAPGKWIECFQYTNAHQNDVKQ